MRTIPNRILKESITTSEEINKLSVGAETLFYRLIVKVDDYGTYFGNEQIVKSECFPLRSDEIKGTQVKKWLDELETAGLIIRYIATDGRKYLKLTTWDKHQRIRAKRSKFPPLDSICGQMPAGDSELLSNVPVIQSNPIRNPNPNPNPTPVGEASEERRQESEIFRDFCKEDTELLDALQKFEKMRKQIRKPLTDDAKELLLKKLQKFPHREWVEIIEQSVMNSWQGIFPLDKEKQSKNKNTFTLSNGKETSNPFLEMLDKEVNGEQNRDSENIIVVESGVS